MGEIMEINEQIKSDFIDYSNYVNFHRALCYIYDGLKPVQRRILYSMYDLGLKPEQGTVKCARIVGDVLGKYHPHGDSSIYGALVRMAQPFSTKLPLITGQGNFGTTSDINSYAAFRYTEAKLSKTGWESVEKLKIKGLVPFEPNFDGTTVEPMFLPVQTPLLLINGTMGIGVGVAATIPPHNETEVLKALELLINKPEATIDEVLQIIKGPDFESGCSVVNKSDFKTIYENGKGSFKMRAKFSFDNNILNITNIPYKVTAESIIISLNQAIDDCLFSFRMREIINLSDKTEKIQIELTGSFNEQDVVKEICQNTAAECSFSLDFKALTDENGSSEKDFIRFNLLTFLKEWLSFHESVIIKEHNIYMSGVKKDLNIQTGLLKALDIMDLLIATIRSSEDTADARIKIAKLGFDSDQIEYILKISLSRLTKIESEQVTKKIDELKEKEREITEILLNPKKFIGSVLSESSKKVKPRSTSILQELFPKIEKVKNSTFFASYAKLGVLKISTLKTKDSFMFSKDNPLRVLQGNKMLVIKNGDKSIYENILGVLDVNSDIVLVSSEGYVNKISATHLSGTRDITLTKKEDIIFFTQKTSGELILENSTEKKTLKIEDIVLKNKGTIGTNCKFKTEVKKVTISK